MAYLHIQCVFLCAQKYFSFDPLKIASDWSKGVKSISYDILGIYSSNFLTIRRIWDMFDQSEEILSGSNEQILLSE